MMTSPHIHSVPEPNAAASSSGGDDGGNINERLRELEIQVAKIDTKIDTLATREYVSDIKTLIERKEATMLRWLLGILATSAIALAIALIRQ